MHAAVRVAIASVCLAPLFAQQPGTPVVYTYVTEWTFPRAQWDNANAYYEKNLRGIMDRHMQDGSIIEWGRAVPLVHSEKGATHVTWYASPTVAGIYSVLEDLRKLPRDEMILTGTHTDQLLRSAVYNGPKDMPRRSAYMMTSSINIVPGKAREWRELWDKNTDPVYADLMKQGTILGYGFDMEMVHTASPFARYEWVLLPNIEAIDKMSDVFRAKAQARSADESRALGNAMREAADGTTHRDSLYYVIDYAHK